MEQLGIQVSLHLVEDKELKNIGGESTNYLCVLNGTELDNRVLSLYKDYSHFSSYFEVNYNSIVPYVFVAKIDDKAVIEEKERKSIYSFFDFGTSNNVLGLISSNSLMVCIKDDYEMKELGSRLAKISGFESAISSIVSFSPFKPCVEYSHLIKTYKIKLINYIDEETNVCIQRLFEGKLDRLNIDYKKNYYTGKLVIYSVGNIGKETLDSI